MRECVFYFFIRLLVGRAHIDAATLPLMWQASELIERAKRRNDLHVLAFDTVRPLAALGVHARQRNENIVDGLGWFGALLAHAKRAVGRTFVSVA